VPALTRRAALAARRVPDGLLRRIIRRRLAERLEQLESAAAGEDAAALRSYAAALADGPLVIHQEAANQQHYELPTAFFSQFLGPRLKYSCCLWPQGVADLAAAEEAMLALTCARAGLEDGMDVLDLGCGWGSLALFIAERYPRCRVTAMSNSRTQAQHIATACAESGTVAVTPLTADIATYDPGRRFDRIMSVEMLEHVRDYRELFARMSGWLAPGGRAFVHVFSHCRFAYTFSADDPHDWMGSRFFSGGQMPAHDLFLQFGDDLVTVDRWWVGGEHYALTLEAWLRLYDDRADALTPILAATYGAEAAAEWRVNWRLFLLACAETFAYDGGRQWGVSHYLLAPASEGPPRAGAIAGGDEREAGNE
jgi:cyclopropane-fatty-acyl-phospholipid synthase